MFDSNSEGAKLDLPLVACDFRFLITHQWELMYAFNLVELV